MYKKNKIRKSDFQKKKIQRVNIRIFKNGLHSHKEIGSPIKWVFFVFPYLKCVADAGFEKEEKSLNTYFFNKREGVQIRIILTDCAVWKKNVRHLSVHS